VDGARFEALTRDLLSRQPGMVHVRQTSVTNEGDANADLLCDWIVGSLADVMQPDKAIPFERRTRPCPWSWPGRAGTAAG
jgi:hypothetical protein